MIPYDTARILYISCHVISILSGLLLLFLYVQQAHNLLLQSCCAAVMLLSMITLFDTCSHLHHPTGAVMVRPDFRAAFSAASISYFTIVVHAHLAFLMLHSCAQACGWPLFRMRKGSFLTSVYLLVSYLFPLLSFVWLVVQERDVKTRSAVMNAFHWAVYQPAEATKYQSCLFAFLGSFFSVYLLFRFTRLRISSLDQNLITQLSPMYLLRITVTTFLYLLIAMSAVYPMHSVPTKKSELLAEWRRPAAYNYIVALIGLLLFAMFGCGSPARKAFKEIKRWICLQGEEDEDEDGVRGSTSDLKYRGSFTVVSEEDEEEIMDFEAALIGTGPEDDRQRYSLKGWTGRRSSDPVSKPSPTSHTHTNSKLSERIDNLNSSRTSQ